MAKKGLVYATATVFIGIMLSAVSFSTSWFVSQTNLNLDGSNGIQGNVLTSYFDGGTGTEESPFIITRPKHWENLIWIHNNIKNFYNSPTSGKQGGGYYFQVGKEMGGSIKVYDYDNYGYAKYSGDTELTSTTLNLSVYNTDKKALIPLGSPQYPFLGTIEGNGITIANFKVTSIDEYNNSHGLEDIGIFGYVGETAEVNNLYFDNFTISTTGAKLDENEQYAEHTSHEDEKTLGTYCSCPAVGYVAGHIFDSAKFNNVYVNNCRIDGDTALGDQLDTYGYYGLVEKASTGGGLGSGNDYNFTFDASAFRQYFDENYETISEAPIRARNTEYEKSLIHIPQGSTIPQEIQSNNTAITPFKQGVNYVTSGFNTYNLLGDDPDDYTTDGAYTGYDYSLSTIGYAPLSDTSVTHDYEIVTKTDHNRLDSTTTTTSSTYESVKDQAKTQSGYFLNWNNNKWNYYRINNKLDTDTVSVNVTVNLPSTLVLEGSNNYVGSVKIRTEGTYCHFFVDGTEYYPEGGNFAIDAGTSSISTPSSGRTKHVFNLSTTDSLSKTYKLNLQRGVHKIGFVIYINAKYYAAGNLRIGQLCYYYGVKDSGEMNGGKFAFDQTDFEVPSTSATSHSKTLNMGSDCTLYNKHENFSYIDMDTFKARGDEWTEDKIPVTHLENPWCKEVVGLDTKGVEHGLTSSYTFYWDDGTSYIAGEPARDSNGNVITNDDGSPKLVYINRDGRTDINTTKSTKLSTQYAETIRVPDGSGGYTSQTVYYDQYDGGVYVNDHTPTWRGTYTEPRTLKTTIKKDDSGNETTVPVDPIYISDNKDIIRNSGYNPKNIDVVGGGFRFSENYVTIDGEEDRGLTSPIDSSSDIGEKFYSTKYGTNSIVLKLTNTGGTNETDVMGTVKFYYAWTLSNLTSNDFKSMCFKKGGTNYVYFEDVKMEDGDYTSVQGSSALDKIVTIKLKRGNLKKAAYCALDKDDNILCGYDSDGNAIGTEPSTRKIKSYILLVGVKNEFSLDWFKNWSWTRVNTRVEKIEFEYSAPEGFGGDFGTVEYRSSPNTAPGTIFNMYFLCPDKHKYTLKIKFDQATSTYTVVFLYGYEVKSGETAPTNDTLTVNFYLYDLDYNVNLSIYDSSTSSLKTTQICTTGTTVTEIPFTSTTVWNSITIP